MIKRKPLDETLVNEFVYGESSTKLQNNEIKDNKNSEKTDKSPKQKKENKTIMDKIIENNDTKERTIRFTVDLPESLHTKLSILAAKSKRKKAEIVRILINDVLEDFE